MNNRNIPSKPCRINTPSMLQQQQAPKEVSGLTKLEYAAIAAMNGFLAFEGVDTMTSENVAKYAVETANALFDELELMK